MAALKRGVSKCESMKLTKHEAIVYLIYYVKWKKGAKIVDPNLALLTDAIETLLNEVLKNNIKT